MKRRFNGIRLTVRNGRNGSKKCRAFRKDCRACKRQAGQPCHMKMILLVDADGDCEHAFSRITGDGDYEVLLAKTSREAFEIIGNRLWRLDLIVIDVDPGAHGLALLEAISACAQRPPIIVVTALEAIYMKPIAAAHGAASCLGKPLNRSKLLATCRRVSADKGLTCDRWGSLLPRLARSPSDVRKRFKGIATKLSPRISAL